MKPSQTLQIYLHLQKGKTLTALEALELFGCFRLSARILNVEKDYGIRPERRMIPTKTGKAVTQYFIPKQSAR